MIVFPNHPSVPSQWHGSTYQVHLFRPISTRSHQVSRRRQRFSRLLHITRITAGYCILQCSSDVFKMRQDNNKAEHHFTTEGAVSGSFDICFWTKWKWAQKETIDCCSHSIQDCALQDAVALFQKHQLCIVQIWNAWLHLSQLSKILLFPVCNILVSAMSWLLWNC